MRAVIVSPDSKTQQTLEYEVSSYLQRELGARVSGKRGVSIEKYRSIADASRVGSSIGQGEEILVVFDGQINSEEYPPRQARRGISDPTHSDFARLAFKMTRKICDEKGIPYVIYDGRVEEGRKEGDLVAQLMNVKDLVTSRIGTVLLGLPANGS